MLATHEEELDRSPSFQCKPVTMRGREVWPGERKTRNREKEKGEREIVRAGLSCPDQTGREKEERKENEMERGCFTAQSELRKREEWKKKREK
jgi:hypothetical protein